MQRKCIFYEAETEFYILEMNFRHQKDNYKFVFLKLLMGLMWHFVQNKHQSMSLYVCEVFIFQ